jgi:hypothetical protein
MTGCPIKQLRGIIFAWPDAENYKMLESPAIFCPRINRLKNIFHCKNKSA